MGEEKNIPNILSERLVRNNNKGGTWGQGREKEVK